MKITLKELRNLVRSEVRKTLRENENRISNEVSSLIDYFKDDPPETDIDSLINSFKRYKKNDQETISAVEEFLDKNQNIITVDDLRKYATNDTI